MWISSCSYLRGLATYEDSEADRNAAAELARTDVDHVEKYGRLDKIEGENLRARRGSGAAAMETPIFPS